MKAKVKILQVSSVASIQEQFNMANIELLCSMGFEVFVAANFEFGNNTSKKAIEIFKKKLIDLNVVFFDIPFVRAAYHPANVYAYKTFKAILNKNRFDIIHCHSPIGGVIARISADRAFCKVIYTAHGFHFYDKAPFLNWLLYYPIEKFLLRYTDVLITINNEDYKRALQMSKGSAVSVYNIPGVGINSKIYSPLKSKDKLIEKRLQLSFDENDFLIIYGAEFNRNKNQLFLIKTMPRLLKLSKKIKLLLAGHGTMLEDIQKMIVSNNLDTNVFALGFRDDMSELLPVCDIAVSPSKREGLPVGLAEAVTCGLPVVASNNRGHVQLIKHGYNGFIFQQGNQAEFVEYVAKLFEEEELRKQMSHNAIEHSKNFSVEVTNSTMKNIYSEFLK